MKIKTVILALAMFASSLSFADGVGSKFSLIEGTYITTGSGYDPSSLPCPYHLKVKLVNNRETNSMDLQLINTDQGKGKLWKTIDGNALKPEPSFFQHPKQSVINFGSLFQAYSGTIVISDNRGEPESGKYVSIEYKQELGVFGHYSCSFLWQ